MSITRTRTRRTPAERSAEILEAARLLALEDGLSALTLRSVAARSHVATGLVAHYHPSMEALIAEVFARVSAEIEDVADGLRRIESPTSKAAALFSTLLDGSRHDVTLVWVEAWSLGRRNAALAEAIEEQMSGWHTLVVTLIDEGVAAGAFEVTDAGLVARQLVGMIDGLAAHALVRGSDLTVFRDQLARAAEVLLGAARGAFREQNA